MKLSLVPLIIFVGAPALGQQQEDPAHRADRLHTIELNRSVAASSAQRMQANADAAAAYRAAQARYQRQLKDWRARVAACRGGDRDACR